MSSAASDAEADADQVEATAVRLGAPVPISSGLRDDLVSESLLETAVQPGIPPTTYGYQLVDAELDTRVGAVEAEIKRRQAALGAAYPFYFDQANQSIHHQTSASLTYEFCLAVSRAKSLAEAPYSKLPRVFERLTGRVVAAFLGEGAEWYRIGWPPEDDRPTRFREAIEELFEKTGEWHWRPHPGIDENSNGPIIVKDGGIDIIAWKYPDDERIGGVTLIGQCACGNDWIGKAGDLNLDRIDQWVPNRTVGKELRFFALPRHISDQKQWVSFSHSAGIIFDRVRLVKLADRLLDKDTVKTDVKPMVDLVLPAFGLP